MLRKGMTEEERRNLGITAYRNPGKVTGVYKWEDQDRTYLIARIGIGEVVHDSRSLEVTKDTTLLIDNVAVGDEKAFTGAYEIMSGTSMACSAAAGAGALIAALEPIDDVQTGAEYTEANRSKLMECVRKTDRLAGKCAAGGFADLTLLSSDDADGPAGCGEEDAEEEYDPDYNDKYTLDYREE
jgi:subtilisin family serine protease